MSTLSQYILPMTVLAAVGSGLMAGLLFAFSNFVMKALVQLPADQGMTAMQLINITIVNPLFLLLFLGTAAVCLVLTLYAVFQRQGSVTTILLVGSLLYLVGTVGVTMVFNVPLNDALAASKSADAWHSYVQAWLGWNHVRAVLSFVAAMSLTYAASQVHRLTP
jgi:uncharacterized membrane protein